MQMTEGHGSRTAGVRTCSATRSGGCKPKSAGPEGGSLRLVEELEESNKELLRRAASAVIVKVSPGGKKERQEKASRPRTDRSLEVPAVVRQAGRSALPSVMPARSDVLARQDVHRNLPAPAVVKLLGAAHEDPRCLRVPPPCCIPGQATATLLQR